MKLSPELIEEIRNQADIVDVIGHYIPLTKKGKGFTAVCPFHDDHDPSLSISQDKQIYKCFVCGNGGNCFSFVSNFKKISFVESVVEVSKIIGKPIEIDLAPKKASPNQPYYDVLNSYVSYSEYLLNASKIGEKALNYLNERGLSSKEIEYFNIGYNPDKNALYKYLNSQKFSDENIISAGVCRLTNNGISDIFYRRITFPIHDKDGQVIAFTARDYENFSESKYINSSDNLLYHKGEHLYNYHRAKEMARKAGYLLLTEGVMDVIAYYRIDKLNCVASLGTALTTKQIELLKTLSHKIVLSYDGDKAGQTANLKNGELLLNAGFEVLVIDNNSELDPDEIIARSGNHALKDLEARQISYLDFALKYYKKQFNLDNFNDRKKMTTIISDLIDKLNDVDEKENYRNALFELTKIRRRENPNNHKIEYNDKAVKINTFSIDGLTKAEYTILVSMALNKQAASIYQKDLGFLLSDVNQKLANLIIDDYRKNGSCSLSRIYDECDDNEIRDIISDFSLIDSLPSEFNERTLKDAIEKVKLEMKHKKADFLREKVSKNEFSNPAQAKEYLEEYLKLVKELGGQRNG